MRPSRGWEVLARSAVVSFCMSMFCNCCKSTASGMLTDWEAACHRASNKAHLLQRRDGEAKAWGFPMLQATSSSKGRPWSCFSSCFSRLYERVLNRSC